MYHRQSRRQQPSQVRVPHGPYGHGLYSGRDAYAFPSEYVTQPYDTYESWPQQFYAPSTRSAAPYGYDASPYYDYEPYEEVAEPSPMDMLDWEEQQLLAQEARLAAERQRLAAEKRRLQAAAAEQERIRLWKLEQARRQQAAKQQQVAEARRQAQIQAAVQQQIRQRQLNAQKEAQLEAALRELECSPSPAQSSPQIKHCVCPNHARAQTTKTAPKSESASTASQHPFGWILRAIVPESSSQGQCCRQKSQARTASPKSADSPSSASPAAASSSSSYSAPKATTNANFKRSEPVNIVKQLSERITAAAKKVGDLISTQFDQLSLRQFGKLDGELMQILLALDGISDANKDERKALVKETMSLLSQVDQYKDEFSRSSSEASSSQSSEMDVSEHEEVASEPEEVVEDIDADSNASDVESAAPAPVSVVVHIEPTVEESEPEQAQAHEEEVEVSVPESSPESETMDVSEEIEADVVVEDNEEDYDEEMDADDEDEYVEDYEDVPASEEPATTEDLEDSYAKPLEDSHASENTEVLEESQAEDSESVPVEDDPFGFNKIHAASKSEPIDLQRSSVPIQIGGARKATVSIETAPASQ